MGGVQTSRPSRSLPLPPVILPAVLFLQKHNISNYNIVILIYNRLGNIFIFKGYFDIYEIIRGPYTMIYLKCSLLYLVNVVSSQCVKPLSQRVQSQHAWLCFPLSHPNPPFCNLLRGKKPSTNYGHKERTCLKCLRSWHRQTKKKQQQSFKI